MSLKQQDLDELLELEKKFYAKVVETLSITNELREAVEREDGVSIRILIAERQRPLLELQETQEFIKLKRLDLTKEDALQFDRLVAGGDATSPAEYPVAEQIQRNQSMLSRLIELDKRINQTFCGDKSIYHSM